MCKINFCKFHGFGNDYIVVEKNDLNEVSNISKFTKEICHRNTGVGGDGIALLEKLDGAEADYSCRIINPDGSEAGFSGNGTRCAVAYLYYKNKWSDKYLKLKTKSGIKHYEFLNRDENSFWYLAELGKPKFSSDKIPFEIEGGNTTVKECENLQAVTNYDLPLLDGSISITAVNVGNPVCVIFTEDFDLDWRKIGAEIESHAQFPERTNVVFVKVIDNKNIEIRIWERGAGETSSSGTCSIAAAVASAFTSKTGRKLKVHAEGGITEALWRDDDEMLITGSADLAFCGEWIY